MFADAWGSWARFWASGDDPLALPKGRGQGRASSDDPLHCGIDPEKSGQKLLFEKLLIGILAKIQEGPALIFPARNCNEKQKTHIKPWQIKILLPELKIRIEHNI